MIGWVNLALAKVLSIALGWERLTGVLVGLAATGGYAALAGLRGVVAADLVQFAIALAGAVALAWYALAAPGVGGIGGLLAALPDSTFRLWPEVGTRSDSFADASTVLALPVVSFIAYLGIQWVGELVSRPGAGRRRLRGAAHDVGPRGTRRGPGTLWFTVAHYCLRPWPWVLVALAALVLYPDLSDREAGYVLVLRDHLPPGWRGLLVGAFFAAYMSTVSTQLNWGTSYLVNDVYGRFLRTGRQRDAPRSRFSPDHHPRDGGERGGHVRSRIGPSGMGVRARVRRRSRVGADLALVLVAGDRRLGVGGTGCGRRRFRVRAVLHQHPVSRFAALSRALDHGLLARRHTRDSPRAAAAPDPVLPAHAAGRPGLETHCRGRERTRARSAGRPSCGAGQQGARPYT